MTTVHDPSDRDEGDVDPIAAAAEIARLKAESNEHADPSPNTGHAGGNGQPPTILRLTRRRDYDAIPEILRDRSQWVTYKLVPKPSNPNKYDKVPYDPRTGQKAAVDNPATYGSFKEAVAAVDRYKHDGIGFVFTKNDPFSGLDLDNCRDKDTGEIAAWGSAFTAKMATYSEQSISGTGVHCIGLGPVPEVGHKHTYESGVVEMYDSGRFFAFTGIPIPDSPEGLTDCTEALQAIHDIVWADDPYGTDEKRQAHANTDGFFPRVRYGPTNLSDAEVLNWCRTDKTGELFIAFYDQADLTDVGLDDSRADWFVWSKLIFYIGNEPTRVKRLAELGEHYRHSNDPKWAADRKAKWSGPRNPYATLQDQTIAKILASRTATQIYGGGGALDIGEDLHVTVEKSLAVLSRENDPKLGEPSLFLWGDSISWVKKDEQDRPLIAALSEAAMKVELDAVVRYVARTKAGGLVRTRPPEDVVKGLMGAKAVPLPPLSGISEVPVLRPDGTVFDTPGYDPVTGLLYRPVQDTVSVPRVSDNPSDEEVRLAFRLLHEVIIDFPFSTPSDRANALGAMLTLVMRAAIGGNIPLGLFDAPRAGTGKGLLAETIIMIATGQTAGTITAVESEAEWRKTITAALLTGQAFHVIDNVDEPLGSAKLSSLLTTPVWEDRVLGGSGMVRIARSARGVWYATGNNVALAGDMPRRVYRVRIDARVRQPFLRQPEVFKHWPLLDWVSEERHHILHALLTVCRAWYARGKPTKGAPTMGSFEHWSQVIWGVLSLDPTRVEPTGLDATCYGAHFLANGREVWDQGDTEAEEWEPFLQQLYIATAGRPFTAGAIARGLRKAGEYESVDYPDVLAVLPGELAMELVKPSFNKKLGWAFRQKRDARYGDENWRVVEAGEDSSTKVALWRVEKGA